MPHIAMVIPSLAGGGAERTALRVAGGLAARGRHMRFRLGRKGTRVLPWNDSPWHCRTTPHVG